MDGTIGEIRIFAGNYAPKNWAYCMGQILPIKWCEDLYSVIGFIYGGNGRSEFRLPDLRGRVAAGVGKGTNVDEVTLGQRVGEKEVVLTNENLPVHNHVIKLQVTAKNANTNQPFQQDSNGFTNTNLLAVTKAYYKEPSVGAYLKGGKFDVDGQNRPITLQPPGVVCNFIICISGSIPKRTP